MEKIPNSFYRVSIKGLILDEARKKFLITLENNGFWEIPGGGLDFGETPQDCLRREIREEMGLTVTDVESSPSYVLFGRNMKGYWTINLVFEVKVKDLNFTKSDECQEIRFVSPDEVGSLNAFRTIKDLAEQFNKK